jgi:carboxypeptidase Taq
LKTQPGGVEIKPLDELKARLLEVEDLKAAASLLRWDQMTYMPPGGAWPAAAR